MILDKEIEIVLNGFNIKGYRIKYGGDLKINTKLVVDINDISEYSGVKINCRCEICGFESKINKYNHTINKKNGGYYGCKNCKGLKLKNTCIEKYGVENVFQNENIKDQIKLSNLEKYGVENVFQNENIKDQIKLSNLEKYGVEYYTQTDECRVKSKQTNTINNGVEFPMQSDIIKEKSISTCLEKYGVDHYSKTDESKEKYKETCMRKYGVENPFQSEIFKEKIRNTNMNKYGVLSPMQNLEIFNKSLLSGYKIKKFNESLYYQGSYELDFLNLCDKLNIVSLIERGPTIRYNDNKVYFSDFFIKDYNLIVEIKSEYTYNLHREKNDKKKKSCISNGYNFLFIVNKNYIDFLNFII